MSVFMDDSNPPRRRANLDTMPGEVMDAIGFYLAISSPGSRFDPIGTNVPPAGSGITAADGTWLASKGRGAEPSQEELKARSSDFEEVPPAYATPPAQLPSLLLSCRHAYDSLNSTVSPRLYSRIFKTKFDYDAIQRRFGEEAVDPTRLTAELKRRCITLKRIKKAVVTRKLWRPDLNNKEAQKEVEENLWLAYLMLLENDGKNIIQLRWASIEAYVMMHYNEVILEGLISMSYPTESVDRTLSLHLQYLLFGNVALAKESMEHCEELMFVLRPYVFAAHRFDAALAPWTMRDLPSKKAILPSEGYGARTAREPFKADLSVKYRASEGEHCGRRLQLLPPILSHAAIAVFFQRVERDPQAMGLAHLLEGSEEDGQDRMDTLQGLDGMSQASSSNDTEAERAAKEQRRRRRNPHDPTRMRSRDHDRDFARLYWCHDPSAGLGLKPSFFKGCFEGAWEGRFSFFDFDSYRDMLAGLMSSLYEGPFGEQPQVWKMKEHFVRIGPSDVRGGKGSILSAGYTGTAAESEAQVYTTEDVSAEDMDHLVQNRGRRLKIKPVKEKDTSLTPAFGSAANWTWNASTRSRRRTEDESEYPSFGNDELTTEQAIEYDDDPDKYEIRLTGTGHSAWGRFNLKGRIRSWDGMMIMKKEYTPDGRGRWLYRGYALAGGKLVGRWRDTFTPETMSGYEGCFCFFKRDDE